MVPSPQRGTFFDTKQAYAQLIPHRFKGVLGYRLILNEHMHSERT